MKNKDQTPIPIDEAARLFAVSARTVRRLIDNGELCALRIGSTLALPPTALPEPLRQAFLDGREDRLLALHDVALMLTCAPFRVRDLTTSRLLRAVQIGRSNRWSLREVEAFRETRDRK